MENKPSHFLTREVPNVSRTEPCAYQFRRRWVGLSFILRRVRKWALSAAINKYVHTLIEKGSDGKIHIISAEHRIVETWQDIARMDVRDNVREIPLAALKELGRDISANHFLASVIPQGT